MLYNRLILIQQSNSAQTFRKTNRGYIIVATKQDLERIRMFTVSKPAQVLIKGEQI